MPHNIKKQIDRKTCEEVLGHCWEDTTWWEEEYDPDHGYGTQTCRHCGTIQEGRMKWKVKDD